MRVSKNTLTTLIAIASFLIWDGSCFSLPDNALKVRSSLYRNFGVLLASEGGVDESPNRRSFVYGVVVSALSTPILLPVRSFAETETSTPTIATSEFETILKNSYRSVRSVEFAGPRLEKATVRLIDGTTFGINDLVESSTDPRSPLRLMATLKGYNVPTSTRLEVDLASSKVPKKRKMYRNSREEEAAIKEAAKRERMRLDEEERLRELERMREEANAAKKATK